MIELRFESLLAADAGAVWREAATMRGVNAELGPWIRMTHPADRGDLLAHSVPLGETLFRSWVLLFGLLPLDRHALALERILPDGFDERSTSWLQKVWIHRRRVVPGPGGARVSDELRFTPRIAPMAPLLRMIVAAIFRHRHRQLVRRYGITRPA